MTREEALKIAKPILFNTEMVRAILDGRKTVTRRIIKHDIDAILNSPYHKEHPEVGDKTIIENLCMKPYQIGDILYVRETWNISNMWSCGNKVTFIYRGDKSEEDSVMTISVSDEAFDKYGEMIYSDRPEWRPSIHMPKEAARIFLRVNDVRVERLLDMKFEDCLNEGAFVYLCVDGYFDRDIVEPEAKKKFGTLWDSTIKKQDLNKYGWYANPWVWVIEFERIEVE